MDPLVSVMSNNDLLLAVRELYEEFNKTKEFIINLTRHLDGVEELYNRINKELDNRHK